METPRDYGLEHDEFRAGQLETIKRLESAPESATFVFEAPTGSGKTAIARAIGRDSSVTALCRTKALQQSNYVESYEFDGLFGRGNYPCLLSPGISAASCEFAEVGMHQCPQSAGCPYLVTKEQVKGSTFRSLNYAYWLTAKWPRAECTEWLTLDEAHLLSDITLDWAGCTVDERTRKDWRLPEFPNCRSGAISLTGITGNPVEQAVNWLTVSRGVLRKAYEKLNREAKSGDTDAAKKARRCESLGMKLSASITALSASQADWYIVSGPRALKYGGAQVPGFCCKPLTARHHFPHYFLNREGGNKTLLMSATIGDFNTYTAELGITSYNALEIPNQWDADTRPVYVHPDAPPLGRAAKAKGDEAYDKQADIIMSMLRAVPSIWSGVILCTAKSDAKNLASRLCSRGLQDRVWVTPERQGGKWLGTQEQYAAWIEHRSQFTDSLCVSWGFWEGVDMLDERICIIAKVPFPNIGDPYELQRMRFNGKFYQQRAAWQLEQGAGRTRRGRAEDYDTDGKVRGLVGVVDGNWKRLRNYLSKSFRAAVTEWPH